MKTKKKDKNKKETKLDRIKKLKCNDMIYEYLAAGYPATSLARKIQVEKKECLDVKYGTLVEYLKEYRAEITPCAKLIPRLPHIVMDAEKQFADKLEDLKRLEALFEANMFRFDLLHANERLTDSISQDLDKVQSNLIKIIEKMHDIKMDLGLSGSKDLGTLTVSQEKIEEMKKKHGEAAARAMSDPVQRNRVLAAKKALDEEIYMRIQKEREEKERREKEYNIEEEE